jgi:hypothetical protein
VPGGEEAEVVACRAGGAQISRPLRDRQGPLEVASTIVPPPERPAGNAAETERGLAEEPVLEAARDAVRGVGVAQAFSQPAEDEIELAQVRVREGAVVGPRLRSAADDAPVEPERLEPAAALAEDSREAHGDGRLEIMSAELLGDPPRLPEEVLRAVELVEAVVDDRLVVDGLERSPAVAPRAGAGGDLAEHAHGIEPAPPPGVKDPELVERPARQVLPAGAPRPLQGLLEEVGGLRRVSVRGLRPREEAEGAGGTCAREGARVAPGRRELAVSELEARPAPAHGPGPEVERREP